MSHELFHDVTETRPRAGRAAGGTLAVSIVAHAAMLAAVIVVPLLATDALPEIVDTVGAFRPDATPPPDPPPPAITRTRSVTTSVPRNGPPIEAADEIRPEAPPQPPVDYSIGADISTQPGDVGRVIGGTGDGVPQPPSPPPPPAPQTPLRVTSVNMPTKIRDVAPIYPVIAQQARIEGSVIIEAVIAVDGSVRDARVLKSIALLDGAALEAVRGWRYAPTRVNGVAVPVIVTVTVQFRLQR